MDLSEWTNIDDLNADAKAEVDRCLLISDRKQRLKAVEAAAAQFPHHIAITQRHPLTVECYAIL